MAGPRSTRYDATYVDIDLEMKRRALAACSPPLDGDKPLRKILDDNRVVITWLEGL
jgi:hypothetical protein